MLSLETAVPASQVAACVAGAAHAALQLLQSPQSVRQRAAELLRELLPGIASAPDESVFNAFAKVSHYMPNLESVAMVMVDG